MRTWKILLHLLLTLLLSIGASGVVSAKVASGSQNLIWTGHQAENVFNWLTCQGKSDRSTTGPPECSVVPKSGADNIANGPKLADQLRQQSARSPFTADGKLTNEAIQNSREIIPASRLNNSAIPKGYSKYSTETFQSPSGNFQTHFYRNADRDVLYDLDYKNVFNAASGK
jgi:hypothetical protein